MRDLYNKQRRETNDEINFKDNEFDPEDSIFGVPDSSVIDTEMHTKEAEPNRLNMLNSTSTFTVASLNKS